MVWKWVCLQKGDFYGFKLYSVILGIYSLNFRRLVAGWIFNRERKKSSERASQGPVISVTFMNLNRSFVIGVGSVGGSIDGSGGSIDGMIHWEIRVEGNEFWKKCSKNKNQIKKKTKHLSNFQLHCYTPRKLMEYDNGAKTTKNNQPFFEDVSSSAIKKWWSSIVIWTFHPPIFLVGWKGEGYGNPEDPVK